MTVLTKLTLTAMVLMLAKYLYREARELEQRGAYLPSVILLLIAAAAILFQAYLLLFR